MPYYKEIYITALNISSCIMIVYISYGVKEINRYLKKYIRNRILRIFIIIFTIINIGMFYFVFGALQSFRSKKSKYSIKKIDE